MVRFFGVDAGSEGSISITQPNRNGSCGSAEMSNRLSTLLHPLVPAPVRP